MNDPVPTTPISPLRQRLIDDMNVRRFSPGDPAQLHPRCRALRHVCGARVAAGSVDEMRCFYLPPCCST